MAFSSSHPRFVAALFIFALLGVRPLAAQEVAAPPPATAPASPTSTAESTSIIVLLDNSAKAKPSLHELEKGVAAVAKQFSSDHEVALMTAAWSPTVVQDFTSDTELLTNALNRVQPTGSLDFYGALAGAVRHVRSDATNSKAAVIFFVNDLNADTAAPSRIDILNTVNKDNPVPIYVIALRAADVAVDDAVQRIAVTSGGASYAPAKPEDFAKIARVVAARLGATPPDANTSATSIPKRGLASYTSLVVREVPAADNRDTAEMSGGENLIFERILVSRLQRAKVFPSVWEGPVVSGDSGPETSATPAGSSDNRFSPGNELEMLAMVVGYRRGNRAQRQFMPEFGGAARMKVQVILRDRATRETVATFVEEGADSSGLFGGSDEKVQAQAMLEVSNKIVARLKKMKNAR